MKYGNKRAIGSNLPFRPGVGMMIIDKSNRIFVARRIDAKSSGWQMPQGGIDLGETPSAAALREMLEEIGSSQGHIIAESKSWYSYKLPEPLIPKLWNGKYCGQRQKWFLIRFTGSDQNINISTANPEFSDWRWIAPDQLLKIVIPFKSKLYEKVLEEFKDVMDL